MSSDAVGTERISSVVGYKLVGGNFATTSPNLPQRIALIGEANEANQATLDLTPKEGLTLKKVGELYGFGSPLYLAYRILKPVSGGGIGGIPVKIYPQAKASGATAKVFEIEPVGTATGNGVHTIVLGGRKSLDGVNYDININTGDTQADITAKIEDVINAVLGAPASATSTDYLATVTSKWRGKTADALTLTIDDNGNDLGIEYDVNVTQNGGGTPSIATALSSFGDEWNTIVLNTYGTETAILSALETTNGIPSIDTPTGRFATIVMKPFIAITGSVAEDPSTVTDARSENVTIAIAPAPLSAGLPLEAAANMTVLYAVQAQNNPHLDVQEKSYPDMPTPTAIGDMSDYDLRDTIVKKGCSTVNLEGGKYVVKDFVTTYHPSGEVVPQFRYVRNLTIDFNVYFGYHLLEEINVKAHAIADDNDIVDAPKVVKPKQWKAILNQYADDLANRALIVQSQFMKDSIIVNLSTVNPDRLETRFSYKRSGFTRIASTTAEAGFNFGTV